MNRLLIFFLFISLFSCKEKTDPFIEMNNKIVESNSINAITIESLMQNIIIKSEKNDDLFFKMQDAKKVDGISKTLINYIEDLKKIIKKKNSTAFVNELFFNNSILTTEAEEFLNYIEIFKSSFITTVNNTNPEITAILKNTFDIGTIEDRRGNKTNWLTLNFKDFPPQATIVKLSSLQSDINRITIKYFSTILNINLEKEAIILTPITKPTKNIIPKETTKSVVKPTIKPVTKPVTPIVKSKKTHIVSKGDNMYRIAIKYKISIAKLKKINGITNNNLVIGQKLKVE